MTDESARVVLAVVTRPHALAGEVRAKVFNTDTEVLVPGVRVTLSKGDSVRTVRVESVRQAPDTWVLKLAGVGSIDEAEAIRGAELSVSRGELPPLDDGEFYHLDLVGCAVLDARAQPVGTVREVIAYPSVDAAVVVREGASEIEVPLVEGLVLSIDVTTRRLVIDTDALDAL